MMLSIWSLQFQIIPHTTWPQRHHPHSLRLNLRGRARFQTIRSPWRAQAETTTTATSSCYSSGRSHTSRWSSPAMGAACRASGAVNSPAPCTTRAKAHVSFLHCLPADTPWCFPLLDPTLAQRFEYFLFFCLPARLACYDWLFLRSQIVTLKFELVIYESNCHRSHQES